MRILVVEDNEKLAASLKKGLANNGFAADCVFDGETAERRIEVHREDYDLVVLDLMLPKKNGIDVCRSLREKNIMVPILMLTAKNTTEDKILGLNSGADDYLAKPFSHGELVARINALLRRPSQSLPRELKSGDVRLDLSSRKVYRGDEEIPLTLKEFMVLEYLMRHPNEVVTREQILSHAWDFAFESWSNVVEVHIKNLRQKIYPKGNEKILETIRGIGYRLKA
jgi:DNA-binding response OmpR family regulator